MSEHLTETPTSRRPPWRPMVQQGLAVVLVLAVAGALAGVLWELLWTPPPGVAVGGKWVQDEEGLRAVFAGTGYYVAVALTVGLVVGAVVCLVFDRAEVVTLVAVVAGSFLAGWVMYRVGVSLGPDDPGPLAETAPDLTALPGTLEVSGWSPFLAFPCGALMGLVVVFFGTSGRRTARR